MKDLLLFVPLDVFAMAQYEFIPLGPLYLSSFLSEAGFEVDVTHGLVEDIKPGYKFYGVSTTTAQYNVAREALKKIRGLEPLSTVIVGGAHFNSNGCVQQAELHGWDHIVIGEGEIALRGILSGKYQSSDRIIFGEYIKDINSTPFPDFGKLDLSKYSYPLREGLKCLNLITSRGCPFKCSFCSSSNTKLRQRSVDNVLEEVELLTTKYGIDSLTFVDDTMSIGRKRYNSILSGLESYNLKWRTYARTTTVTYGGLERMKRAGCIECSPGIESGDQGILDLVNKGTNVEDNIDWCIKCEDVGITCSPFLIIGLPNESKDTIEATRRFVEKTKPSAFAYNILMPFPDSPMVKDYESYWHKYLTIYPYTWDDCVTKSKKITDCFVSTPYLSREQILEEYYKNFNLFAELTGFDPRKRGNRKD